jgi:glucose/mannose-6-phosphate isomerase
MSHYIIITEVVWLVASYSLVRSQIKKGDSLMNLDDKQHIAAVDAQNMLAHIDGLPEQFLTAWKTGLAQALPESFKTAQQVVICGMGGSAIGGDLLGGLMNVGGRVSVVASRSYDIPAWAKDQTLIVASSFSGNTEETLGAYQEATQRGLPILAITTGGKLAEQAKANGHALWQFDHVSPPRAALGWSLGMLLALAHRLDWLPNLEADVAEAYALMQKYRPIYGIDNAAATNPAKRLAGQYIERMPAVFGSGAFEVVARRWKTQLNENSKIWAMYEAMPEANHNNVVGIEFPEFLIPKLLVQFIRSAKYDHPRVALRYDLTGHMYMTHGLLTDTFTVDGESLLAQMMHAILFGDYLTFYAAVAKNADPTVIVPIDELKAMMAKA